MPSPTPKAKKKTQAPVSLGRSPAGGRQRPTTDETISIGTGTRVAAQIRQPREKIQLCGDSTVGKTFSWLTMARKYKEEAEAAGVDPPHFYVIDTDDAMPSYLAPGMYFEDLAFDNGGNVFPFPAFDFAEFRNAAMSILLSCSEDDWIIVDVVNKFYDMSQRFVATARGLELDDQAFQRAIEGKGFGAFDGNDWNLVNRTFEAVILQIINNPKTHKIFVQHITDLQDIAGRERRELLALFDQVGMKPRGAPKLSTWMRTIIMLWGVRQITRDERKKRISAEDVRFMAVIRDNGEVGYQRVPYDRNFYDTLLDLRANATFRPNVIDMAEAERIDAEAKAEVKAAATPPEESIEPAQPKSKSKAKAKAK